MNICIFASGEGSNFKVIYSEILKNNLSSHIELLVSNKPTSGAVQFAIQNNIKYLIYNSSEQEKNISTAELLNIFEQYNISLIILAGYLKKIEPEIVQKYKNRIINIHPALLPAFGGKGMYGMNVHKAVIENGEKKSGITIHFVDDIYDNGNIIFQKSVDISDNDDAVTLQKKVQELEHKYLVKVLKKFEDKEVE